MIEVIVALVSFLGLTLSWVVLPGEASAAVAEPVLRAAAEAA